jgi:hypothetical protein
MACMHRSQDGGAEKACPETLVNRVTPTANAGTSDLGQKGRRLAGDWREIGTAIGALHVQTNYVYVSDGPATRIWLGCLLK